MDREEIKAHLIVMRRWIVRKGLLTGECVAWARIKEEFGIGESDTADDVYRPRFQTVELLDAGDVSVSVDCPG